MSEKITAIVDEQPVVLQPVEKPSTLVNVSEKLTKAPNTTAEENLHSASQRRVNIIWEGTQASIAIFVTVTTLYVAAALTLRGSNDSAAFLLLSNAFFLVIGFYFGRTNHQRTGGVGGDQAGTR